MRRLKRIGGSTRGGGEEGVGNTSPTPAAGRDDASARRGAGVSAARPNSAVTSTALGALPARVVFSDHMPNAVEDLGNKVKDLEATLPRGGDGSSGEKLRGRW